MAIQDFTAGQILTAAQMDALQANDYNWTVSTKTDSYVLVAADKGTRVVMNSASAKTITVNSGLFASGDTLEIINIGAGTCTVTAGTCTVTTAGSLALAQWGGGTLYFTSASAAIFFSGGGLVYGTATGGTGVTSTTVGGVSYNYTSFTSTGTLTITKAGVFDVLLFGAGSGGEADNQNGGGGGSGGISQQTVYLTANQTVTIGGGGAGDQCGNVCSIGAIPSAIAAAGGASTVVTSGRNQLIGGMMGKGAGRTNDGVTNIQGYVGGQNATGGGGGGGSTTAVGGNASTNVGGVGGAGYDVSAFIGGSALFKGAGGGGGGATTGGAGGSSIGGTGASGVTNATSPAANSASGGGGRGSSGLGAAGGSGIVYVRWKA
jgi:hypothetical protein